MWVYGLFCETPPTERAQALRKLVAGLKTKRQYLQKKNTAKREDLEEFLNEPFFLPAPSTCSTSNPHPVKVKVLSQSRIERRGSSTGKQELSERGCAITRTMHNTKGQVEQTG